MAAAAMYRRFGLLPKDFTAGTKSFLRSAAITLRGQLNNKQYEDMVGTAQYAVDTLMPYIDHRPPPDDEVPTRHIWHLLIDIQNMRYDSDMDAQRRAARNPDGRMTAAQASKHASFWDSRYGEMIQILEKAVGVDDVSRKNAVAIGALSGLSKKTTGLSAIAGRDLPPDLEAEILGKLSGVETRAPAAHLNAAKLNAGITGGPVGRVGPGGGRKGRKTRRGKKRGTRRR